MTPSPNKQLRAHYQRLRLLSCGDLWSREVPLFEAAPPRERIRLVGVVRAVGVVFSESGSPSEKQQARVWLRSLLSDPVEKVRRYAMAALPKLGAGEVEERELLLLAAKAAGEREEKALAQTLSRIGGKATLEGGLADRGGRLAVSVQRVKANVARKEGAGSLVIGATVRRLEGIRVALRCRAGLAPFVVQEVEQSAQTNALFRIGCQDTESVELIPQKVFSLNDLYAFRCFGTLVFPLGRLPGREDAGPHVDAQALAALVASGHARHIMQSFTKGTVRYRLEFPARRVGPGFAAEVAGHVFEAAPVLLNDPRQALWEVVVREGALATWVELSPRLRPDPRFAYRRGDVPAASHPPLAAAMARLAGLSASGEEKIWDPFCGSGLELAECALRGGRGLFFGTDLDPQATSIAKLNFAAATQGRTGLRARFVACDFRKAEGHTELADLKDLSLMVCNPPLGKRVPMADLRAMVRSLFALAGRLLRPGGRLVFVNPVGMEPQSEAFKLGFRQTVDLGFAHLPLEKWVRREPTKSRPPSGQRG